MANDFYDLLMNRRSIRSFKPNPIEDVKLVKIMFAANKAPSAGNLKARKIITVTDQGIKDQLTEAALNQKFISEAPAVWVFCANSDVSYEKYGQRGASLYSVQDATISCAYAQLAIVEEGMGSCWVGAFDDLKVAGILKLSWMSAWPVAILPFGYY
jgi:nitroreductase